MPDEQQTFSWGEPPQSATGQASPLPAVRPLAERLQQLAGRGVYLGTSSWKYPGWLGRVYDPARYATRGRFSQKKFNASCLAEYTTVFPTVCGDFAFYQFPSPDMWAETFAQVPPAYQFSLKIPEDITVERFPKLPRYGRRAGMTNAHFMDTELLGDQLLARLEPHRDRLGVLIFQFGTFHEPPMSVPDQFAGALDAMLSKLPTDRYRFAVEVRNPDFLDHASPYLGTLRAHRVAHCLNSWTRMPAVGEQMRVPGVFTAPHAVARFLLRPGRTYQQAVEQFAPYERASDPWPEGRDALRELIDTFAGAQEALYAFVNNRFEGNAVETIEEAVG